MVRSEKKVARGLRRTIRMTFSFCYILTSPLLSRSWEGNLRRSNSRQRRRRSRKNRRRQMRPRRRPRLRRRRSGKSLLRSRQKSRHMQLHQCLHIACHTGIQEPICITRPWLRTHIVTQESTHMPQEPWQGFRVCSLSILVLL
jgi:hypothetical protein